MTTPPTLSTKRDEAHPTPVAIVPIDTLVDMHHVLSGAWGMLNLVDCQCGTKDCNVARSLAEVGDCLEELTVQLVTVPDITLADLEPDTAQWLAQIKSAVEDQAKEASA